MGGRMDKIFYIETNWFNYEQYINRYKKCQKEKRTKNQHPTYSKNRTDI